MARDQIYISASLLKDYLECPRKVYYRLDFPELIVQNEDMIVGNILHYAIEKYWNDDVSAFKYVETEEKNNNLSDKYREKIFTCLDNFYKNFRSLLSPEDLIEYRFKVEFGRAFLVGKMDRITKSGIVIDWKTSTSTSRNISRDPQFVLYHYAYQNIFNKPPVSVLKVNLYDATISTYERDSGVEFSLLTSLVNRVTTAIKEGEYPPTGVFTGKCGRCPCLTACHKELGIE
jgi:hypothetical protein